MHSILAFLLRALVLAAGLVFAASLAVVFAVALAAWLLRAGWARLTGRPASPFVVRADFRQAFRRGAAMRPDPVGTRLRRDADVTDVEPKPRA
jgi:hypothetical protein